jgi:hypothetical protein
MLEVIGGSRHSGYACSVLPVCTQEIFSEFGVFLLTQFMLTSIIRDVVLRGRCQQFIPVEYNLVLLRPKSILRASA